MLLLSPNLKQDLSLQRIIILGLIPAILVAFLSPNGFCTTLTLHPRLSITHECRDNILFTEQNQQKDHITIAGGSIAVKKKTARLDASARAEFKKVLYHEFDELNSLDKAANISAMYRLTETLKVGARTRWSQDALRGNGLTTSGLALTGDRKAAVFGMSGNWQYTELSWFDLALDTGRTDIRQDAHDEASKQFSAGLTYGSNLTGPLENTQATAGLTVARYNSRITDEYGSTSFITDILKDYDTDVYQARAGFSHRFSPLWNLNFQAGLGYTDTRETVKTNTLLGSISGTTANGSLGNLFQAVLTYMGEYHTMGLSGVRDVKGGAGTNGAVTRTSGTFDLSSRFSHEFSLTLMTSVFHNENKRTTARDIDTLTVNVKPGFRYRFENDFILSGYYMFSHIDDRITSGSRERNLFFLKLTKDFTYKID
jgi:hypothetical protein